MGNWTPTIDLPTVCSILTPKAKASILVAAKSSHIRQGTWNGCAFNAASKVHEENVASFKQAADLFGMSATKVKQFIQTWDAYDSDNPTRDLVKAIEAVGVNTPAARAVTAEVRVHISELTEMRETFDSLVSGIDLTLDNNEVLSREQTELMDEACATNKLLQLV